jgi:hypothetical protein
MRLTAATFALASACALLACAPAPPASETDAARTSYVASCSAFEPPSYCRCIADAFSNALTPSQMSLAALAVTYNHVSSTGARARGWAAIEAAGPGLGFPTKQSQEDALLLANQIEAAQRDACMAKPG